MRVVCHPRAATAGRGIRNGYARSVTTTRLWIIAGGAAAAVAALVLILVFAVPRPTPTATPTATPTRTTSPSPTQTPTTSPSPTPTTAPTPAAATCENTSTSEFQALARSNGWISWSTVDEPIGARPFDDFPGGTPEGFIVCRWGAGPEVATDNVIDLAWARIDSYNAVNAMLHLEETGWTRSETDATGSTLFTSRTSGPGGAFLFTPFDVRWAAEPEYLDYITSPDAGR